MNTPVALPAPRQQINLYTAELRPQRAWLSLGCCLGLAALALGLAVGLVGLQARAERRAAEELEALKAHLAATQAELAEQQVRLARHVPAPELVRNVREREQTAAARDQLIAALVQGEPMARQGFSPLLTGLARHPQDGLWLDRIAIQAGELSLSGYAREAELVPRYVEALVGDAALGPRGFESLELAEEAERPGVLRFALHGRRPLEGQP